MRRPVIPSGAGFVCLRGKGCLWLFLTLVLVGFVAGCSSSNSISTKKWLQNSLASQKPVLLMPLDIELAELTVGGSLEPNAAWTAAAKVSVDRTIDDVLAMYRAKPIRYRPSGPGFAFNHEDVQLAKLYEEVRITILEQTFEPDFALPTKRGKLDWSLGPDVARLRRAYGADYAVFIHLRDSFSSNGRIAYMMLSMAVGLMFYSAPFLPSGGSQFGFVSLVDLRTGNLLWVNSLYQENGDLRQRDSARQTLGLLFRGFPL